MSTDIVQAIIDTSTFLQREEERKLKELAHFTEMILLFVPSQLLIITMRIIFMEMEFQTLKNCFLPSSFGFL